MVIMVEDDAGLEGSFSNLIGISDDPIDVSPGRIDA